MTPLTICLIIFVITMIGFALSGSLNISITVISMASMVALLLTGTLKPATALGAFGNSSAILMGSMFVVAAGLSRTQLINKISAFIVRISKGSFTKVLAGYVILTFILAQFIPSAVVCFTIIFPLLHAVCREMKVNPSKMMFSIGITAVTTVITLPLSSAVQELARIDGFLKAYQYTTFKMTLMDITYAKLPVSIILMILAIFIVPRFAPDIKSENDEAMTNTAGASQNQTPKLHPVREVIGYLAFFGVIVGFLFSTNINIPTWEIALAGAIIVAASGILNTKELVNALNMNIILMYVGALGIGSALSETGAAQVIGDNLSKIIIATHNNYIAGLLMFIVPFILTQFMLNLGVYSIFAPLYIMICKSMGANPIGPIMLAMIAAMTAYFTPLATPAVPVMMAAGNFKMKHLFKMGIVPAIIITVVCVGWVMTIYPIF